jgi:hypothetical protein
MYIYIHILFFCFSYLKVATISDAIHQKSKLETGPGV